MLELKIENFGGVPLKLFIQTVRGVLGRLKLEWTQFFILKELKATHLNQHVKEHQSLFKNSQKLMVIFMSMFSRFLCASINFILKNRLWKSSRNCLMTLASNSLSLIKEGSALVSWL